MPYEGPVPGTPGYSFVPTPLDLDWSGGNPGVNRGPSTRTIVLVPLRLRGSLPSISSTVRPDPSPFLPPRTESRRGTPPERRVPSEALLRTLGRGTTRNEEKGEHSRVRSPSYRKGSGHLLGSLKTGTGESSPWWSSIVTCLGRFDEC